MDDYLKIHSTDDNTVMASVEDYRYFLDELDELNMLVTRAATDEEYSNSVKLYMSFQQLNRALRTDEENIKRTAQPHQQHAQRATIRPTRRQTITRRDLQPHRTPIRNLPQSHPVKTRRLDTQRNQQPHRNTQSIQQLRNIHQRTEQRTEKYTTPTASKNTAHATSIIMDKYTQLINWVYFYSRYDTDYNRILI